MPNRLAREKSPYLLQHANNPVDWHPWGEEAFEKARREDKPIFLSIGYSTCHWCHVMERESFENEQIAGILNESFVPIKVDREERPDVDRIYMTFVQATTGGGGWPMSVWLTPELKPFFGGTYFPPEGRYNHPGFGSVLRQLAAAWQTDRARIADSARDVVRQLEQYTGSSGATGLIDQRLLDGGFFAFRRSFDSRLGGFGGAPKFPRPSVFDFLLRYHVRTGSDEALQMSLLTLQAMALGGMNDQLGGGFHRYSVDERWFVPHFEKMLYDQAQLAVSYLEAFQITRDPAYADVARATLDYVLRDMTSPEGGFWSAEDADSVIDPAHPHEKGEGAFYVWTAREIEDVAGDAAPWIANRYGVESGGNVRQDPHEEFVGKNILFQAHTVEDTAAHFGAGQDAMNDALARAEAALLEARSKRIRPHLDDKILTAWNGLMISALARAAAVLGERRYLEAARRAADFIVRELWDAGSGVLLRRYRDGEAAIPGFLDDYAFFAEGLIHLYEAGFESRDLQLAVRLTDRMRELFEDPEGGFFSTAAGDPSLVLRVKDDYDGAEPSGNSVAAMNLIRLGHLTGRAEYGEAGERTLRTFGQRLGSQPQAAPRMLAAAELLLAGPRQVVVADRGTPGSAELLAEVRSRFLPFHSVMLADDEARAAWAATAPALASMRPREGRAMAYVCNDFACQEPVSEAAELAKLLQ